MHTLVLFMFNVDVPLNIDAHPSHTINDYLAVYCHYFVNSQFHTCTHVWAGHKKQSFFLIDIYCQMAICTSNFQKLKKFPTSAGI